jgi:hypothetical protein
MTNLFERFWFEIRLIIEDLWDMLKDKFNDR